MNNLIESIINAVTAKKIDPSDEFAVVPEGYQVEDLQEFKGAPRRIKTTIELRSAQSFCDYVSRFADEGATVFCDLKGQRFTAVLDYHENADSPAWSGHKATYTCPIDSRWKTWTSRNGKPMSQVEFAQFIEDNLPDIVKPEGADMLTVSRTLQAKKKVEFNSDQNLSNGDIQFTYNETTNGSAGNIEIPQEFVLGIPVYEGGAKYEVIARLRYRISEGKLSMWYDLVRPERMEEDAFKETANDIQQQCESAASIYDAAI
ncbi:DUF2303 family protein [Marinobacterium stanieri]|uniref:DUF2303 family protein n=1 Tax=Marinobacterium stanieri TaxID=49186 RepID=UPI000255A5D9|nr:DUF2303 family protein [Marinobacterium stanieri]